jgi:transcriptional regulator with XRE-family HTH domain
MTFGQILQKYRLSKDVSITALAQGIGVSRTYLSRLENEHEKTPSYGLIEKIVNFLSLPKEASLELLNSVGKGFSPSTIEDQRKEDNHMEEKQPTKNNIEFSSSTPVLFSDAVLVTSNENGLVLNFAQALFESNYKVVSRIGLTAKHAKSLVKALEEHIEKVENLEKRSD